MSPPRFAPPRRSPIPRQPIPHPTPRPVVAPALLNGADAGTQWTNLGSWRHARTYPEAARELALRVGRAALLAAGDVVIDCACGHGDSLALWVREFGVTRVIGVEADATAAAAAESRVRDWGLSGRIRVCLGSAESFVPAREAPEATAVVCTDAAYHFADRAAWLRSLATSLTPGTRLAFSDIVVSHEARLGRFLRGMAERAAIPGVNLWTVDEIEPACAAAGIEVGRLVRCGSDVLGGFAMHASRSSLRWMLAPGEGGWRALGTAAAIARLRWRKRLGYVIVAARTAPTAARPRGL